MTESLSRLDDLVDLVQHTVGVREKDVEHALEQFQTDMQSFRTGMQSQMDRIETQVKKELSRSQQEFNDAQDRSRREFEDLFSKNKSKFDELQAQVAGAVDEVRARTDDDFCRTVSRLEMRFKDLSHRHTQDVARGMTQIKECSGTVSTTVRAAQSAWMRAQSQLAGLNTWAVACVGLVVSTGSADDAGSSEAVAATTGHDAALE
ncbi:hypothetical protein OC835_004976 [Tilletia horrida]|nr:hypothetical protein OC835_004976 [Tilletia horrida]